MYGIDPLGLSITSQKFFIEGDVPFGVDASCGLTWCSSDGAVDFLVLEAFVDKATVACDASGGVPAVDVALLCRYIEGWLIHSALVRMGPWYEQM